MLLSRIHGQSVLAAHELTVQVDDGTENGSTPNALSYDAEIIRRYQPDLQAGSWFSAQPAELEVVISENRYGWSVGDTISVSVGGAEAMLPVSAKVVGVLRDGAEVFGLFRARADASDEIYRLVYDNYSFAARQKPLLLFSSDALEQLEPSPLQSIYSSVLISYPAGTTQEVLTVDQQTLAGLGCAFSMNLQEMNQNSKRYLYEQFYQLFPIIVVLLVLVLVLVSSISSSTLATRRRLRDYAKFYLVGLQWKQCIFMNLLQSLLTGGAALLLTLCGLPAISLTPLANSFRILPNGWLALVLSAMLLLYLCFSMLMPWLMLRRTTPNQVLKSN